MKLRNKKTGEIADLDDWTLTGANDRITVESDHDMTKIFDYNSLAELNEEWEDYEEPKGYYYVTTSGLIKYDDTPFCAIHKDRKEIGNYFNTREDAELAVRKLKAWKRLKDKGFRFGHWVTVREKKCGKVEFKCDDIRLGFDEAQKFYNDMYIKGKNYF